MSVGRAFRIYKIHMIADGWANRRGFLVFSRSAASGARYISRGGAVPLSVSPVTAHAMSYLRIVATAITLLGAFIAASARGQSFAPEGPFEPSSRGPSGSRATAEGERPAGADDEIETDRDSFTPATTTAAYRRMIFESAYSFIDNRATPDSHSYPELIVRYGLTDRLEFRLGWNYEVGGGGSVSNGSDVEVDDATAGLEREGQASYGFKASLTQQRGLRPQSAVIVQGFTPTSGLDPRTQLVGTYVVGWRLPRGWTWDSSLRYGTDASDRDHFNSWAPSTVLKVPVGERWKAHVEYFGIFSDGKARETCRQFFSPGAHYLITPDLEVGVRLGWGLNSQTETFFSNVGLGYRF